MNSQRTGKKILHPMLKVWWILLPGYLWNPVSLLRCLAFSWIPHHILFKSQFPKALFQTLWCPQHKWYIYIRDLKIYCFCKYGMVRGTSVPFYYLKRDHDKVIMTFSSQCTHFYLVRGSLPIPIHWKWGIVRCLLLHLCWAENAYLPVGGGNSPVEYFERMIFSPIW